MIERVRAGKLFRTKLMLGGNLLDGCDSVEKSGEPYCIYIVRPSGTYSVTIKKMKPPVGGSVQARSGDWPVRRPMNIELWDDWDE